MNELGLFISAFVTVFALGFQQKNVNGNHYYAAVFTSLAIGSSQIFLWRVIPTAAPSEIVATLLGGPAGIVSAMWLHPRLMRFRSTTPWRTWRKCQHDYRPEQHL